MLYIAELQELDRELNEWFRGPPSASSKHSTYMNKYFKFCAVTGVPVLPLSLITFCRYAKWLPENNINSGWPGVKSYIGALAQFNVSMGGPDPRAENPALWSLLRTRFKQNTQIKRTTTLKFALRGGHIQALCLLACDSNTPQSIADAASDTLMQFSAVRVGHIAPKDTKNLQHVLSWHHLEFIPSVQNCRYIFTNVESSKTRSGKELKPFWTALGKVTSCRYICPVTWMVKHFLANYTGNPSDPIFSSTRGGPLPRAQFQLRLQQRLTAAMRRFLPAVTFNVKNYTGISFRKSGITALSRAAAANRLLMHHVADFADHQDIQTSRRYDEATLASRATFSDIIGAALTAEIPNT